MFYAHFVLSKRGPLAKIWLAAHWEKKLTKAQVYETNIDSTVDAILEPKVKLALRTSGHLLLGVVRIYSRKAKYLLADCNEAFVKIKMAFRPGVVDLPDDHREVAPSAITLQENFDDFNANFDDFEMDAMQAPSKFAVNQSRPEEITIKEDVGTVNFITDDGFGEVGIVDDIDGIDGQNASTSFENALFTNPAPIGEASDLDKNDDQPIAGDNDIMPNDGFGDEGLDADFITGGLFEDVPVDPPLPDVSSIQEPPASTTLVEQELSSRAQHAMPEDVRIGSDTIQQPSMSDTTLLPNEDEAFALEPLDTTSMVSGMTGMTSERKPKRRRKLMVDDQKGLDSQAMKEQLVQTNDIVTTLDLAPPTRKLMQWKEAGAVEKLFSAPGRHIVNKRLSKMYGFPKLLSHKSRTPMVLRPVLFSRNLSVVISSEGEEHTKHRHSSVEHGRLLNESSASDQFVVPADPDIDINNDTTMVNDESIHDMPRKKRRTDDNQTSSIMQVDEDIDSADDDLMPTEPSGLADQESTIVAEESTGDEVEDKRMNRRTHAMITTLSKSFDKDESVSFLNMVKRNQSRKQVAAKFYTCLVLKKHRMIEVEQESPYSDIIVSRGPTFAHAG